MKHTIGVLTACVLLQVGVSLAACGDDAVVKWPSLKRLDTLAERCEALCDQKDTAALRKIAGSVKAAAATVVRDSVPAGAKRPDEVKVLQGDLKSLADAIQDPAQQDGAELTALLAGIHPVVEKLMEAAGLPHVHETEKTAPQPGKDGKS